MQPHNLLHNSAAPRETIRSVALRTSRDTVAECRVEELKAMLTARGGGVTGRDGKAYSKEAMQRIVRAYLSMEKENTRSTVYFNRAQGGNGIFAKIDTSERKSAREILNQLVCCKEFEPSLQRFFADIRLMFLAGGFVNDYSTIVLEAPELSEKNNSQSIHPRGRERETEEHRIRAQERPGEGCRSLPRKCVVRGPQVNLHCVEASCFHGARREDTSKYGGGREAKTS